MWFAGKSILATGAGSGIGRETARLFACEGARVFAVDPADGLEETASDHEAIATARADADSDQDRAAAIATGVSRHRRLDIVCAHAAMGGGLAGLFDQTAEYWAALLRVNQIKPRSRAMLDAGRLGAIICTASVAGRRAGAGRQAEIAAASPFWRPTRRIMSTAMRWSSMAAFRRRTRSPSRACLAKRRSDLRA